MDPKGKTQISLGNICCVSRAFTTLSVQSLVFSFFFFLFLEDKEGGKGRVLLLVYRLQDEICNMPYFVWSSKLLLVQGAEYLQLFSWIITPPASVF